MRCNIQFACCSASCLCLSHDRMAAMACTKPIRPAPTSLKATVWQHFEFHEVEVKTDKTYTVCKVCGTQLKDFGNTTNLRNHLARYHPELGEKQRPVAGASQRAIGQVMAQLQPNSKRAKGITKSTASFNALALRPYSVVENVGFGTMVFTLEPNTKYHLGVTSLTQPYRHATVKIRQKFWTLWWKWDFRIEIESYRIESWDAKRFPPLLLILSISGFEKENKVPYLGH